MVIAEVIQKDLDVEYCDCEGCYLECRSIGELLGKIQDFTEYLQGLEVPSKTPIDLFEVKTPRDLFLRVKQALRPLNEMLDGLEPLEDTDAN